jgi:hypothetical protein
MGSLAGCGGSDWSPQPGKGGSLTATISNGAQSTADTDPFNGVSDGGGESIGGSKLQIAARMDVDENATRSITLQIDELNWTPQTGPIQLGGSSPATLDYTEVVVDVGYRDWRSVSGTINITAISKTSMSFTIAGAIMSAKAGDTITLDGTATDLVF